MTRLLAVPLLLSLSAPAWARSPVPDRSIPSGVLSELRVLENRFVIALAEDCDPSRCYSKGCYYVNHAVADQPKSTSLPGLSQESGPGSVIPQEYLTAATCAFAYERSVETAHVKALSRRLQSKLSTGWTVVKVDQQRLQALPDYLQTVNEPPVEEAEPVEEIAPPEPEDAPLTLTVALNQLWAALLPHFFWMIGLVLFTLLLSALIWAWRRLGQASIEEKLLLAELSQAEPESPEPEVSPEPPAETVDDEERAYVQRERAEWTERMEALSDEPPDRVLEALFSELLRSDERALLAKAMLYFPTQVAALLPSGGQVASAKLELADYLKNVDPQVLPTDADFFRQLNRHARSAEISSQDDAQIASSLREDFGSFGLSTLIGTLAPRAGALVFAFAPLNTQHEMVRLLSPAQRVQMSEALLMSNRMSGAESAYLFKLLAAARADTSLPPAPSTVISDRGPEFNAIGALSVFLENVEGTERTALFERSVQRAQGRLPSWHRALFLSSMLLTMSTEARADLLLEVDVRGVAAWLSLLDPSVQTRALDGVAESLRVSIQAVSVFASRAEQLALAEQGRAALAAAFQRQLSRLNLDFERVLCSE